MEWQTPETPREAQPTAVLVAGILLLIGGAYALLGIWSAVEEMLFLNELAGEQPRESGAGLFALSGVFLFVILLVWAVLHLVSSLAVLRGRDWGRTLGVAISLIGLVVNVLGIFEGLGMGNLGTFVLSAAACVLYIICMWLLWRSGPYFAFD